MPNMIDTIKIAAVEAVKASDPAAVLFGTVVSASPLKIKINEKIVLLEQHLILTSLVQNFEEEVMITRSNGEVERSKIAFKFGLESGEKVILMRKQGGQRFVVMDRVR